MLNLPFVRRIQPFSCVAGVFVQFYMKLCNAYAFAFNWVTLLHIRFCFYCLKGVLKHVSNMVNKLTKSWFCALKATWDEHCLFVHIRKLIIMLQSLPPLSCTCFEFPPLLAAIRHHRHVYVFLKQSPLLLVSSFRAPLAMHKCPWKCPFSLSSFNFM